MKVKIFTEGGPNIGLGHIARCTSLYDEIRKQNYEVDFFVFGEIESIELLKNRKVISANWIDDNFLSENVRFDDYCIVDSYLATKDILEILSMKAKKVLFIDDMNRINYPRGIVVNPSLDIGSISYLENHECTYFWGPDYIILRSPFINVEREEVRTKVDKVMITMGGSDFRNLTPIIINEICNHYPQIKFDIVIGATFSNINEIKKISNTNITFHYNVDENTMRDLMVKADYAITAAGQTIYELLATRTPFIPIQIADNQSNNINSLCELDLIINSIDYSSDSLAKELNESFVQLLDYKIRNDLVLKFQNVIDGKGRERIIKKLVNNETNSISFRAISPSDCDLLYEWANDESVRKNAFNSDKIDYESHKKWFQSKLDSKNTLIYIILKANNPIGQIRIGIENDYGIIDYSIDYKYRGQGLGKSSLKTIGNRVKNDCTTLKKLVGRVKFDNVSSQKAFESANFKKEKKNGYFEYQMKL